MKDIKEVKTVAVHDGSFHADDVFAIALLQLINSKIEVIRTRDEDILKKVDMRIDVGMKYDFETLDFDHHQNAGKRENGISYASFGLVWKHFWQYLVKTEDEFIQIDEKLVQPIDADDNGEQIYEKKEGSPYTLSMLIGAMNPDWQDKNPDYMKAFEKAVKLAKSILKIEIKKVKGKSKVIKILQSAINKNKNGKFLILEKLVPWKNFLVETNIEFVVYQAINGSWHVQAVPLAKDTFENKKDLPKSWAGLQADEFAKISGVEDAIFCHKNLFLCGAKSKKGALKLVKLALKNGK